MTVPDARLRIGISSCLLGEMVRYDGGHKRDPFLVETFGRFVEWVPVCPEVGIGLGTPREAIRLVRSADEVRLVGTKSGADHTARMRSYSSRKVSELERFDLCGYILKKDSPSCGMTRVKVYNPAGMAERNGQGLFAAELQRRMPALPVEEEGRLTDPRIRENFVERVFARRRLLDLFSGRWTVGALVRVHTAHKLVVLSHSTEAYKRLGRLVAEAKAMTRAALRETYEREFMAALAVMATPKRHVNVLQHMLGYLREGLDEESRHELLAAIEDYRAGLVPLIVPVTLMRHHVRRCGVEYLAGQVYLDPHPKELMLRNHV